MSKEQIRAVGGIVHSDGNIFFTNQSLLDAYVASLAQPVQLVSLGGVNTERLTQALSWMGAVGPVSLESYVGDMGQYINYLTAAVIRHKQGVEASTIAQPVKGESS